jgi:endo-1,4-beta-xylanase
MFVRFSWHSLCAIATVFVFLSGLAASLAFAAAPVQVLKPDTVSTVDGYNGPGDTTTPIPVTDTSVPFTKGLRVSRASIGEVSYAAALRWSTIKPIKKGDLLVATFYVRNTTAARGALNIDVTFQLSGEPYTPTLTTATPVDTVTWKKYAVPFRANQDYPVGGSTLQMRYALAVQAFEVGGVAIANYGPVPVAIPKTIADGFAYYYPGRGDAKAAWRTAALARIEANRKGNMTVRVVDKAGKPVPGATVKITQTQTPFVWGTATSAISLVCKVDVGDSAMPCPKLDQLDRKPVSTADFRKLRKELLQNFNGASFYNDLKWPEWYYDKPLALAGIAWMKRNKLPLVRGHNLIWPAFEPDYQMPRDLINRTTTPTAATKVIADHFKDELTTLRGQVTEWDVVNEPFNNYDIQGRVASPNVKAVKGLLGPSAVATWFKDARRLDPKALIFLNDFGIFENFNPTKQANDVALVKYIKSLGAPIDGIGFQGHFGASGPVFKDMQRVIDDFSPLVKTFSVTEFDFETLDPKLQADLMGDVMTFVYGQPKFNQFQMWGFWEGDHWLGSAPIYNRDWSLKPSGVVWQALTRKTWRTNTSGVSSAAGVLSRKAFYGIYKISVTVAGKTCDTVANFSKAGEVLARGKC